jgi:Ca-activated chloride channel family protein
LTVPACAARSGSERLLALYAREHIEDAELALAAGLRERAQVDREIESLGIDFQIASRLTSWVAVSERVNVDGTRATRRVEQPHVLPAGMSAEGLGLRPVAAVAIAGALTTHRLSVDGLASAPAESPSMRMRARVGAAPASAAEAARAKRGAGVLGRVTEMLTGRAKKGEVGELARSTTRLQLAFEGELPELRVRGKIRIRNERRLAISFELPCDTQWKLPVQLIVKLADGSEHVLKVERSASTRSGRLLAGQRVRLVCRLEAALPDAPHTLTLEQPAARWIVELEA